MKFYIISPPKLSIKKRLHLIVDYLAWQKVNPVD